MEQAEATDVECVILWRVQRILESLLPGELDAWLHRAGLAGSIGQLRCEVERMETVVNGVKGRAVGNKPLARCLARVKELMHDADIVVDELDYCRLQHEVEEVNLAIATELEGMVLGDGGATDGSEEANASASSSAGISDKCRKNRSKERDYFHITPAVNGEPQRAKCIDCGTQLVFSHGTSALRKHRNSGSCKKKRAATEETPNRPSAGEGVENRAAVSANDSEGRKRTGIEGNVATVSPHWDHAKFSKRIDEISRELGTARVTAIDYLQDSVADFLFNKGKNSLGYGCGLTGDDNAILEPATMADPPGVAAADAGPYLNTSETSAAVVQPQPSADAVRRKRLRQQEELSASVSFESLAQRLMQHQESLHRQFVEAMERRERERDEAWRRQEADKFAREAAARAQDRASAAAREAATIAYLEKISGESIPLPPAPAPEDDTSQQDASAKTCPYVKRPFFTSPDELLEQLPEKKRRLTPEQVHLLERSFEEDNELEPERKTELARKLGLQPWQVAVWFENRRARWKTKQLERDFDRLKANFDALRADHDVLVQENHRLRSQLQEKAATEGGASVSASMMCSLTVDTLWASW